MKEEQYTGIDTYESGVYFDGEYIIAYNQGGYDCMSIPARELYEYLKGVYEDE